MEKTVREILTKQPVKLCVVSTNSASGAPESAVMAYALADGMNIILSTHMDSRKWNNIKKDPFVSLVFGWDFRDPNVQYEGKADLITDDEETEEIYYSANPELVKYRDMPGNAYIKIRPTWIRVTDHRVTPPEIKEAKV